ncbi:hypothetical protein N7490_002552 [Penicillium lividum]|nr:hypothetical protein N7490_002552 [Penicillium lividum]
MLSSFFHIARIGIAFMLLFVSVKAKNSSVKTYAVPDEVTASTGYNVSVRPHGGDWVALDTFQTKHEWVNVTTGSSVYYTGSMASFDFSGTVDVSVTYTLGSISAARPNATIVVSDGKTLYLAGGAVVEAQVNIDKAANVSIRGHGVLYHPPGGTISAINSTNYLIEDIIVVNPSGSTINTAQAENVVIRGIRSNLTIQDSSFWADVAHPINIGTHGNTQGPETMSGVTIRNVDILDHREPQVNYQGCIAINPGDENVIENVLIGDVRVEDFRLGQLINFRVTNNTKYNTSPGRGISNVSFRVLSYTGKKLRNAIMAGYNDTRIIDGVTFENLTINGLQLGNTMSKPAWYEVADFIPMYVNEHVKNLNFTA